MFECDDCGDMIFEGDRKFSCARCNFDMCENCVKYPQDDIALVPDLVVDVVETFLPPPLIIEEEYVVEEDVYVEEVVEYDSY